MNLKQTIKQTERMITEKQVYPHCDLDTEKIYGCKKGSWNWWHEKGHIEFNKLPYSSSLKMWQGVVNLLWMVSITLAIFNKWMMVIVLPMLGFYIWIDIYEERWCNKYANSYTKRKDL